MEQCRPILRISVDPCEQVATLGGNPRLIAEEKHTNLTMKMTQELGFQRCSDGSVRAIRFEGETLISQRIIGNFSAATAIIDSFRRDHPDGKVSVENLKTGEAETLEKGCQLIALFNPNAAIRYNVGTFREAGLEAKWGRTKSGAPVILARWPKSSLRHQRETWWIVDAAMFENMKVDGVVPAFNGATLVGDIFSIRA